MTIATNTCGTTGNTAYFDIGNGYKMALSLEMVLTPEGEIINNNGVMPQIYIEPEAGRFTDWIRYSIRVCIEKNEREYTVKSIFTVLIIWITSK